MGVTPLGSFINGRMSTRRFIVKLIVEAATLLASCQSVEKLDLITSNMRHRPSVIPAEATLRVRDKTRSS